MSLNHNVETDSAVSSSSPVTINQSVPTVSNATTERISDEQIETNVAAQMMKVANDAQQLLSPEMQEKMRLNREHLSKRPVVSVGDGTAAEWIAPTLAYLIEAQERKCKERGEQHRSLFSQRSSGRLLVRLTQPEGGLPKVVALNSIEIESALDRSVMFVTEQYDKKTKKTEVIQTEPPYKLVHAIISTSTDQAEADDVPLPRNIRHVVTAPYFNKDGRLIQTQGYNADSEVYLDLSADLIGLPTVPATPTPQDVQDAVKLLCDDLLKDFAFYTNADRAHALAMLLSPFVRELLGPATRPMGVVTAADKQTGKTLLTKVIGIVGVGREMAPTALPTDEAEIDKRILPILRDGHAYALLDNVSSRVESDSLDRMLTGTVFQGRTLGKSEATVVPNTTQWLLTGNRVSCEGQIARRSVTIAVKKQPEDYVFKHKSLESWARVNRPKLVHAVLTLIQHWIVNKQRRSWSQIERYLPSFETFSAVIGGILEATDLGLDEGFLARTLVDAAAEFDAIAGATTFVAPENPDAPLIALIEAWAEYGTNEWIETGKLFKRFITPSPMDTTCLQAKGLFKSEDALGKTLGKSAKKSKDDPNARVLVTKHARYFIQRGQGQDGQGRVRTAWKLQPVESITTK